MTPIQKSPRYQVPRASLSVTSSLSEETNTNLIAHNNSGYSFCLMYKTLILKIEVTLLFQQLIIAES